MDRLARYQLQPGSRWHQPVAGYTDDAAYPCMYRDIVSHRAEGQELHGLHAAARVWHPRRLPLYQSLPLLYFLGSDVDTGLFPGWQLGWRPPYLRGFQV